MIHRKRAQSHFTLVLSAKKVAHRCLWVTFLWLSIGLVHRMQQWLKSKTLCKRTETIMMIDF